jgi:NADPH-dependent F420 reductase
MRIAVIGTGKVGSTLGRRWAGAGHDVVYGSRRPDADDVRRVVAATAHGARAARPEEAVRDSDLVVLAVPGTTAVNVVTSLGELRGRVLVDCTNPILPGLAGLSVGTDDSGAEQIARAAPGARVVKAFNTTGSANMEDPLLGDSRLAMFLCGDDPGARAIVIDLAKELGFEPVDCGPLSAARYLEPLAMLWISLAYQRGMGPRFGFALVRQR